MFKLYQRYLIANFLPPFMMSLVFFVTFLLTSQLFRLMRLVTRKGVDIIVLVELFGHIAISFLPMAVPLSLLFGTMYTLNKLSEDSEIVAIRSVGIRKSRIFFPFLVVGVLSAVAVFGLNRNIIPYSKRLFKNTVTTLTSKGFLADIKKEQFYTDIPGVTLFTEEISKDGKEMTNVFIKLKSSGGKDKIIMAKKGVLIKPSEKASTSLNLRLDLYKGNIISMSEDGQEFEKILFDKYEFPIVSSSSNKFINKNNMRSSRELAKKIKITEKQIAKESNQKKKSSLSSILRSAKLEYWTRFNVPLQCLAFILLGFVFGIKKGRGRAKNTSGIAMVIIVIYYALFFTGISLANKGRIEPVFAIFFPTIIVFIIGSKFYKDLDWAS